jgi:CRISPR-associated protein Cmr6
MSLPYRRDHAARNMLHSQTARAGNTGLVFDKFFDGWNAEFDGLEGEDRRDRERDSAKSVWVKDIIARHRATGVEEQMARRQRALVLALNGKCWTAKSTARFVTGLGLPNPLENGFVWHHTGSFPYLPASGLKGALRHFWTQWTDDSELKEAAPRLLGSSPSESGTTAGALIVFDMLPLKFTPLSPEIMTPHYGDWYQTSDEKIESNAPGDWMDPVPIPFLAIEKGAKFQIAMAARVGEQVDWQMISKGVKETLEWIGLGAKTAVGYGRFELVDS